MPVDDCSHDAHTKAKDSKISEALVARDSALNALGSLGAEPEKPAVKPPAPTPSPTKKKR